MQPLWRTYEAHFWSRSACRAGHRGARRSTSRARLVDFRRVQAGAARIALPPGMAITLNGIAQGYITDRIADLLRNEGFEQAVVDLGEWRALGSHPDGRPWRAATREGSIESEPTTRSRCHPAPARPSSRADDSITSSIRRPARAPPHCAEVAVIAPRAMIADALATAICVVGEERAADLLAAYPERGRS